MPWCKLAFKEGIVLKVLLTDRIDSIISIADSAGVSVRTVRRWVTQHRAVISTKAKLSKNDRIQSVLATINLPFEDKSIYCRKNGIMPEALEEWELDLKHILSSGAVSAAEYSKIRKEKEELKKQLAAQEKELDRKNKALAEAAALLLLQKKIRDLLSEEEEKLNQN